MPPRWDRSPVSLSGVYGIQLVLLLAAALRNPDIPNTDAIAYIGLAHHYADGRWELAVSGTWGPIVSWVIALFLTMGLNPMAAARAAMVVSGMTFLAGLIKTLDAFRVPREFTVPAVLATLGAVTYWSVRLVTPDLMMAGVVSLAIAAHVGGTRSARNNFVCGLLWGLAYLTKPVAFPLAMLLIPTIICLQWYVGDLNRAQALRNGVTASLTFLAICSPWIAILSLRYNHLTITTSAQINHAIGAPGQDGRHPTFRTFHIPEPGRITSWEDPSVMDYPSWSPFESAEHFKHQVMGGARNLRSILGLHGGVNLGARDGWSGNGFRRFQMLVPGFDALYLGLVGLIACVIGLRPLKKTARSERWRWAVIPIVANAALYLPVFLYPNEQRYFYLSYPLLWVSTSGAALAVIRSSKGRWPMVRPVTLLVQRVAFGFPAAVWMFFALAGMPNHADRAARQLAMRMSATGHAGPIVGSANYLDGTAGLLTAWHLEQPWYGDHPAASVNDLRASGARYVIVRRSDPIASVLDSTASMNDLDEILTESGSLPPNFPLKVYSIVPATAPSRR